MPKVEQAQDERSFLKNVRGELHNQEGYVDIYWEWPADARYRYCFAFDIPESAVHQQGMDPEILLREQSVYDIISVELFHAHRLKLQERGMRTYLYPARWDDGENDYFVLNQPTNNRSEVFRRKAVVKCQVRYESMDKFLRHVPWKQAIIQLGGVPGDLDEQTAFLSYHCVGAGRDRTCFGIDLQVFDRGRLEIIIEKNEKIQFAPLNPELARRLELRVEQTD